MTAPTVISATLMGEPGVNSNRSTQTRTSRYTPSSFSSAPGKSAMNGMGASSAASGIQVWKGIAPALPSAPATSSTNATLPAAFIGR